jgi:hypothetical protein
MIGYIAAVLELPPNLLSAMFVTWIVIVGASVVVYYDARRHHIGPALGLNASTPGPLRWRYSCSMFLRLQSTCGGVRN